jgi:MFS family permease
MFCYPVIAIIIILLALAFVPNLPVEREERKQQVSKGEKRPLGLTVWVLVVAAFLCFVIGAVIQIKTSIIVRQLGLGGSDVAAIVSIVNTFGIVIFGFIFGWLYKWFGRWLYPIGLLIATGSYFWFANSTDVFSLCISGALAGGAAIGILMVYNIARVTYTAPVERITTAITLITLASYIGQVFTTPFINFVEATFGGAPVIGPQGPEYMASVSLNAVGIVFGAMFVVAVIYVFATRKMDFAAAHEADLQEANVKAVQGE